MVGKQGGKRETRIRLGYEIMLKMNISEEVREESRFSNKEETMVG